MEFNYAKGNRSKSISFPRVSKWSYNLPNAAEKWQFEICSYDAL